MINLIVFISLLGVRSFLGDFEELPVSARALALGNAQTSSANDATAIYYNPAIPVTISTCRLYLSYGHFYQSGIVKNSFIAYINPKNKNSLGVALFNNWISDIKIANVPDPTLPPSNNNRPYLERTVTASDWILYLNYARRLIKSICIGVNLKFIYRYLGIGSGIGTGLDFGAIGAIGDYTILGLKAQNFTTSPVFWSNSTQDYIIPKVIWGISHTIPTSNYNVQITADCEYSIDQNLVKTNLGLEYQYKNIWFMRGGLMNLKPTFGLGFIYKYLYFDYGFSSQLTDAKLGNIHKLSGGVKF
ncbi:MAG: hypothetical protein RMJ65_02470 [candidate division WOR-3 bacterium]|nr:hypothetical protein [candidate division WOR-3 bacterium]